MSTSCTATKRTSNAYWLFIFFWNYAVVTSSSDTFPAERFLDRELSWLSFNQRVLELAEDENLPILERAKFLAIFASNLDEFFMVRVAGLKRRIATGIAVRSASGKNPKEVLESIWDRAHSLQREHAQVFQGEVLPGLAAQGIELLRYEQLTQDERSSLDIFFHAQVFPVLTPLAVDPSHPFPYISGLSLNLAVVVRNPVTGNELFARVKVPPSLPRFVPLGSQRFVPLEDVIASRLSELFPGMQVLQHHSFRVTRNEDVEVEEDDAENLLLALERELMRRRFGPPVRLEVEASIDPYVLELLMSELDITESEIFRIPGPLDLTGLWAIVELDRTDLKQPVYVSHTSRTLSEVETSHAPDIFAVVRERDVLLHHPYDSFSTSVQLFLEQAAIDPHVLAIKQTLYRTSGDSPIVDALITAAENGKQVLAIVEIKARFDEQNNIDWSRKLEEAGVHVVYGLVGLKTHSKASMVVRNDGDQLRRYCHLGTGNYHPKTARLYEDMGLLTCSAEVGEDVSNLFNVLSGYSMNTQYARLLVAPHSVRTGLVERIEREIEHHESGMTSGIRFKCNALVDEPVIDALYRASQAGVPVDVWVRGICALRPGVPGLSDTIRVVSILGRFLEHSRAYCFENAGTREVWIGSADMMHRNLDRRVETLVSLVEPSEITWVNELFDMAMGGEFCVWNLSDEGVWTRKVYAEDGTLLPDYQETLMARTRYTGGL